MHPCGSTGSIGKKPSVKADLVIYGQVLDVFWVVHKCNFHIKTKRDISYCGDKTSFPDLVTYIEFPQQYNNSYIISKSSFEDMVAVAI